MPPKNVPILAIPFLFAFVMLRAMLFAAVNVLALFVCAPYIIVNGTQPKWLDKLEKYFGVHSS